MKAEDTVMNDEELGNCEQPSYTGLFYPSYREIATRQAEISFKAGHREAQDGIWDKVMGAKKSGFDEGRQEGIRLVVEWIEQRDDIMTFIDMHCCEVLKNKKKEWNI